MKTITVFLSLAIATSLLADDLPFWGEDNGEGTNVTATAFSVSASAGAVAVRTVHVAESDPISFSSHPRGLYISIR